MAVSREWVGVRATLALTLLVAALSVITGVANIGAQTVTGPFAEFVPVFVQRTAGFTGALTGFLMLASAVGLQRGYRSAWTSTAVLLPVTAVQGLLQWSPLSVPLVALSLVNLPILLAHRRRFDRHMEFTTTQLSALAALVGAQVYGTVGAYALREQFTGIDTLTDAFYFTIVTGSTVGYGDVTPQTEMARLFGMSVLLVSVSSFAVALGVLLTPAIEARLSKALGRMTESQLDLLENHILVLGHGELTEPIIEELQGKATFLVVTPDGERARALSDRGVDVLTGDPSDESTLLRARVEDASAVLVATNNDAEDALAILTARQLNPEIRISAAATHRENVNKLKRAGADTVISPASIGGHLLVESAMGADQTEEIAARVLGEEDADGDAARKSDSSP